MTKRCPVCSCCAEGEAQVSAVFGLRKDRHGRTRGCGYCRACKAMYNRRYWATYTLLPGKAVGGRNPLGA